MSLSRAGRGSVILPGPTFEVRVTQPGSPVQPRDGRGDELEAPCWRAPSQGAMATFRSQWPLREAPRSSSPGTPPSGSGRRYRSRPQGPCAASRTRKAYLPRSDGDRRQVASPTDRGDSRSMVWLRILVLARDMPLDAVRTGHRKSERLLQACSPRRVCVVSPSSEARRRARDRIEIAADESDRRAPPSRFVRRTSGPPRAGEDSFSPIPAVFGTRPAAARMSLPSIFCSPEGVRTVRLTPSPDRPWTLRVCAWRRN
jgi:hypothetical protein